MKNVLERLSLYVLAAVSIVTSLLDGFGWLPEELRKVPNLTLMGVGAIAWYLASERKSKIDKIESLIVNGNERIERSVEIEAETVIRALKGVEVRLLRDNTELFEYVAKRIKEAKKSIDDLTCGTYEGELTPSAKRAFEKYIEAISSVSSKNNFVYRDIISVPPLNHITRTEDLFAKNIYGYRLRYYEIPDADIPPLMQFMVIDEEEVVFALYRQKFLPSEREVKMSVRHPDIVRLFYDYYDTLWQGGKVLKEGERVEREILMQLKEKYSTQQATMSAPLA